jgi:hypothetical protein
MNKDIQCCRKCNKPIAQTIGSISANGVSISNKKIIKVQSSTELSRKKQLCEKCFNEKEVKPMKTTFRTLAEKILSESKDPLTAKAIWEKASETGLAAELGSGGKTPWNTLAALLYTDVQKKGDASIFIQTSKSPPLFQLRNNAPTAEPEEIAPPEPQERPKAANKPAKPVKAAKKKNRTAKEILEDMAKSDDPAVRKKLNEVDRLAKAAEERLKK